ncbi:hypothetical protein K7X08_023464 [Anisodus acutangulus]|uniref:Uncharacterized protein n=1 Tax=Anisodus acutangulus TaxID=402998 RepID=A0A9Q1LIR6_9SOLA|nr:hypothetical protein K7X08_023464 [Anisodus acutangulus]
MGPKKLHCPRRRFKLKTTNGYYQQEEVEEGEIQSKEKATEVTESQDTGDPGPDDNTAMETAAVGIGNEMDAENPKEGASVPDTISDTEITVSSSPGNQNAIVEVIGADAGAAIPADDVGKEGDANVNTMANTNTIVTVNPSTTEAGDIVIEDESNLSDVIKVKESPTVAHIGSGRKQQLKDNIKKGSKGTMEVINTIHKQHKNITKTGRSGNLDTLIPIESWPLEKDICWTYALNTLQGVVLALAQSPAMYTIHGKCNRNLENIQLMNVTLYRNGWLMHKRYGANTEKAERKWYNPMCQNCGKIQALNTLQRGVGATFQDTAMCTKHGKNSLQAQITAASQYSSTTDQCYTQTGGMKLD